MKNKIFSNIVFYISNRFILFIIFSTLFITLNILFNGSPLPSTEIKDLWFYSGLFMVWFSILFIEPYYTSPKNVITTVIPLLLVFLSIKSLFNNSLFWWFAVVLFLLLLLISILITALENKDESPDVWRNKMANILKNSISILGKGKVLYSIIFIYFLLSYYSIQNVYTLILFVFWSIILIIDTKEIHNKFIPKLYRKDTDQIGEIFGVQSKKIFLVKLYEDRKKIKKFDIVKFRYSMQDSKDLVFIGIVFDTYLLNQEKWAKILQMKDPETEDIKLEKNVVYKISDRAKIEEISRQIRVDDFVGVIIEGSNIGKIKFEYSKKVDDLQEGDLLELRVGLKRLFYQVISGVTEEEKLEDRNKTGFINGEALQLGEWCDTDFCFKKFGWVPAINTPVFKTDASDIEVPELTYPDYELGKIPRTTLPSVINLNEAISHHIALLGVTGSGKSFLAYEIINQIKQDTKVVCIDFNKEFVTRLTPAPGNIISEATSIEVTSRIDWINNELEKFGNQQDKNQIELKKSEIKAALEIDINAFLSSPTDSIKVFELPDVSNTTGILDYTKYFFKVLFDIAKGRQIANNPLKICVVLEEAHTVIPEWNFSGSSDKTSQSVVNSIGQIALQGRKYGVGFLVIAQRTANVSKTVLTQCNTVICFQAFDETSFNFLGNYVGKEIVQVLPNLKQFHAVVAGKAIRSNVPLIIDLTRAAND